MKNTLKLWETAALLALCITLCAGTWAEGRQQELQDSLLRLHVLARSDAPEEQAIKLQVRDAVLAYLQPVLTRAGDRQQAEELVRGSLEGIARAASAASQGRKVSVKLCTEHYPSRSYGELALPAGEYRSLQVVLGEGAGRNWWCVVFPPLCLPAAQGDSAVPVLSAGDALPLQRETPMYRIGFRSVELWEAVKARLERD